MLQFSFACYAVGKEGIQFTFESDVVPRMYETLFIDGNEFQILKVTYQISATKKREGVIILTLERITK
jgi:hypothetical protein